MEFRIETITDTGRNVSAYETLKSPESLLNWIGKLPHSQYGELEILCHQLFEVSITSHPDLL